MGKRTGPVFFCAAIAAGCAMLYFTATDALCEPPAVVKPPETNSVPVVVTPPTETKESKSSALVTLALQSVQQLQEQQQALMRTLEQLRQDSAATSRSIDTARQEADAAAKRYNDALAARLATIEQAIHAQTGTNSTEQLQEQQQTLLRALDLARQENIATAAALEAARRDADTNARRHSETFDARLNEVQAAVHQQNQHALETVQSAHRFSLIAIGICAAVGFFGMLLFALFLLRVMNRRDKLVGGLVPLGGAGYASTALVPANAQLVALNPAEQTSARFVIAMEQLEKRLQELEHTAATPHSMEGNGHSNGDLKSAATNGNGETTDAADGTGSTGTSHSPAQNKHAERAGRIALLLGKGQSLLNLQQTEAALACLDEVLALDPTNAEAFVKKGAALEKLNKLDEAIECYDHAIAIDHSITMAYLCKGGVFNRLERYGEALQCYEQALRSNEHSPVS